MMSLKQLWFNVHVFHHLHERVPRVRTVILVKLHRRTFEHAGQVEVVVVSIKAQRWKNSTLLRFVHRWWYSGKHRRGSHLTLTSITTAVSWSSKQNPESFHGHVPTTEWYHNTTATTGHRGRRHTPLVAWPLQQPFRSAAGGPTCHSSPWAV